MTETRTPYDAGLHPGFHVIARCNGYQVGRWRGAVYVLRDDESREKVRDLKPVDLDGLVCELAELVAQLRDGLVEVGKLDDLPAGPLLVRETVYVPVRAYVCTGFWSVLVMPSPKSHSQAVALPMDWSVKVTVNGAHPEVVEAVKAAVGPTQALTVM